MSARAVPTSSLAPTKEFLQILWTIYFATVNNNNNTADMGTPVVGQSAASNEVQALNLGPQ
jgi:hypothetical protein